jgi:N-acyl-D-amino-acid deacylase
MQYDLKIAGGSIIDGTGKARFAGDVGISAGKVVALGQAPGDAVETIDATGRIVAPGFVDIHTHYDGQAVWSDRLSPSSSHGVTTVVGGTVAWASRPAGPSTTICWSASWRASRTSPRW